MYGSYGSYSSMSASSITGAIDIAPTSSARYHNSVESHCALWSRRSSFGDEDRPSSYLSDDDLFPVDPFEDDSVYHIPSSAAGFWSPIAAGSGSPSSHSNDAIRAMEREQRERELNLQAKMLAAEKERRRAQQLLKQQAMMGSKKRKNSSKTSPKQKTAVMAPISE